MEPGAVVLGTDYRGLGVVQSLGRRGIPVYLISDRGRGVASYSRYATKAIEWTGETDEEKAAFLCDLAAREDLAGWVLVPTRDDTVALCARHRDELAGWYAVSTPSWEVVRHAYDKRLTYRLASSVGIPIPRTWELGNGVDEIDCDFPAIIKPATKRLDNELTAAKAWRVDDRASLAQRLEQALALMPSDELLVQELIPGGGDEQFSFAALASDGRPVATLVARRARQFPIDFGRASTYVESVSDPDIADLGSKAVGAMGCSGLVEVEFKRDCRTGEPKLLDVNLRVWGWHTLGRRAGVDFAYLLWRQARGELVAPVSGESGVRWMWPAADVPVAAREIARRRLGMSAYAHGFRAPVDFATLTRDDPVPGLVELPLQLSLALRRRLGAR